MCFIQREGPETLLNFVRKHPYFEFMRDGIASGSVLPCLRKNEIHFYECGARLFNFQARVRSRRIPDVSVTTHKRYLSEHVEPRKEYRVLRPSEWTKEKFCEIRQAAVRHRNVILRQMNDAAAGAPDQIKNELAAVHSLFPAFSVTRSTSSPREPALIDVEARFGRDKLRDLALSMIDLVFLMPDGRLLFVEAKGVWHKGVQSTGIAKVEKQVRTYQRHIKHPCVLDALNRSVSVQSILLDKPIKLATGVFPTVPILLLDTGEPPTLIGPRNSWLTDRLNAAGSWTVNSERPLVIDGRRDPAAAIRAFVEKFGSPQSA